MHATPWLDLGRPCENHWLLISRRRFRTKILKSQHISISLCNITLRINTDSARWLTYHWRIKFQRIWYVQLLIRSIDRQWWIFRDALMNEMQFWTGFQLMVLVHWLDVLWRLLILFQTIACKQGCDYGPDKISTRFHKWMMTTCQAARPLLAISSAITMTKMIPQKQNPCLEMVKKMTMSILLK